MMNEESINVIELVEFLIVCFHKNLLHQLLFVESVISLQIDKKPEENAKVYLLNISKCVVKIPILAYL